MAKKKPEPDIVQVALDIDLSFEDALQALEEVVSQLDSPQTSLDTAIALYEKGKQLSQYCTGKLEEAQGRIMKLQNAGTAMAHEEEID